MDCFTVFENMLRMWNLVEDQTNLCLDKDCHALKFPETNFVSQFRINGRPILPPLMTESRRKEMRHYREQALLREASRTNKSKEIALENFNSSMQPVDAICRSADLQNNQKIKRDAFVSGAGSSLDVNSKEIGSCTSQVNSRASKSFDVNDNPRQNSSDVGEISANSDTTSNSFDEHTIAKDGFLIRSGTEDFAKVTITNTNGEFRHREMQASPTSVDSGMRSASGQTGLVSASEITVVTSDSLPVDASVAKSSIDSGVYSKDLVSSCVIDQFEGSLTLDSLTLDEMECVSSRTLSDEKVLDRGSLENGVVGGFVVMLATHSSESFINGGSGDAVSLLDDQREDSTISPTLRSTFDGSQISLNSLATALSVESLESNRTIVTHQGLGIHSSHSDGLKCESDLSISTELNCKDDRICSNGVSDAEERDTILHQNPMGKVENVSDTEDKNRTAGQFEGPKCVEIEAMCTNYSMKSEDNDSMLQKEVVDDNRMAKILSNTTEGTDERNERDRETILQCPEVENKSEEYKDNEIISNLEKESIVTDKRPEVAELQNDGMEGKGCETERKTDPGNQDAFESDYGVNVGKYLSKENDCIVENESFSEAELTEKMNVSLCNDNRLKRACWLDETPESRIQSVVLSSNSPELFPHHSTRPHQRDCDLLKSYSRVSSSANGNAFGETTRSCRTIINCGSHPSILPPAADLPELHGCCERTLDMNLTGATTPCSRVRRNSYVISTSENSPIAVDDRHLDSSGSRCRRNSYTLDHPCEALLIANGQTKGESNRNVDHAFNLVTSDDLADRDSSSAMNPCQPTSLQIKNERISNQEAAQLAKLRARAESERVGKLEHMRRFLEQASITTASRDAEDESDCLNGAENYPIYPGHLIPSCNKTTIDVSAALKDITLSSAGGAANSQSSSEVPLAVSEEVLLTWLNGEFERKKRLMEEEHQRHMAQLLAEQQLQQATLHREILLRQQNLRNRAAGSGARLKPGVNSKPQKSCTELNAVDPLAGSILKQSFAVGDRARRAVVSPGSVGDNRSETFDDAISSVRPKHPKVGFSLEAGDFATAHDATPDRLYGQHRGVDNLLTAHQEGSECESPYSLAMLRKRGATSSNSSPQVPTCADSHPRRGTSVVSTPCSRDRRDGNAAAVDTLAELTGDGEEVLGDVLRKFERLPALVRGYLTRRLLKTERVLNIIQTIQDTAEFALHFQLESPMKKGFYSIQDRQLHSRVIAQLTAAMYEIHEIFFEITVKERMNIIAQSRALHREMIFKDSRSSAEKTRRVSAATMKSIERKEKLRKALESEEISRPRSNKFPPQLKGHKPSTEKAVISAVPATRRNQIQRDLKSSRAKLSPRKAGKENIHRILGHEKTRVIASGISGKAKSATKRSADAPPARKLARVVVAQHESTGRVGSNISEIPERQHRIVSCKSDPSGKAKHSESKFGSEFLFVKDLDARVHGREFVSRPTFFAGNGENVRQTTNANKKNGVKSYSPKEREVTRKVAHTQSRFS